MYRIAIDSPDSTSGYYNGRYDPKKRLRRLQKRSIAYNLCGSFAGLLVVIVVLAAVLVFAVRKSHIHQVFKDAKRNAVVWRMARKVRFSHSCLACDYEEINVVEGLDMNYPPVFGNTDAVVLKADIRSTRDGAEARKNREECKIATTDSLGPQAPPSGSGKEEMCKCHCEADSTSLTLPKSSLHIPSHHSTQIKPKDNTVTVYQVGKCSIDRKDEAEYLINTIAFLRHLKGIPGIPSLVDFFEDRQSVYATVTPFLHSQLSSIAFSSSSGALAAIASGLKTLQACHERGVALMSSTPKTIYMGHDRIWFEPAPAPLLLSSRSTITLPMGMVLPRIKPELRPGGTYPASLDTFLYLHAFYTSTCCQPDIKERLKQAMDRIRDGGRFNDISAGEIGAMFEGHAAIDFGRRGNIVLAPYHGQPDGEGCTLPVYDYMMDLFRAQQRRPGAPNEDYAQT